MCCSAEPPRGFFKAGNHISKSIQENLWEGHTAGGGQVAAGPEDGATHNGSADEKYSFSATSPPGMGRIFPPPNSADLK